MTPLYTPTKFYQNEFKTFSAIMFADRMTFTSNTISMAKVIVPSRNTTIVTIIFKLPHSNHN